jgi:hypothetical protein
LPIFLLANGVNRNLTRRNAHVKFRFSIIYTLFLTLLSLPPGPVVRLAVADSASGSRSNSTDCCTGSGGGGGVNENKNVLAQTTTSSFINSSVITDDSEGERAGVEGRCCST